MKHVTQTSAVPFHALTIRPWDFASITVCAFMLGAALWYTRRSRNSDKGSVGACIYTPIFNSVALIIAVFAAQYPILKLDWLPDTELPKFGEYSFQLAAWFIVILAAIRFIWTLLTLRDYDRLYLTGQPDSAKRTDRTVKDLDETAKNLEKAEMLLLDKTVRRTLEAVKNDPTVASHHQYYWVLWSYLIQVHQSAPEFATGQYAAYAWLGSELERNVPDVYWKLVQTAVNERDPAEDTTKVRGTAYYVSAHDVVLLVITLDNTLAPVSKSHITSFVQFFDAFWQNI